MARKLVHEEDYRERRSREYPPLTELADALVHAHDGDQTQLQAYYQACLDVKSRYPKENKDVDAKTKP
jgi:hypothetical protein